jgi:hypothetical protein
MPGIGAVVGYAIGTFQVLFVDWWRRIASHRRQLRLLRAELRRMRTFESKFSWDDGLPPMDEYVAVPPKPTDLFMKTVGETEWVLTDEHRDDNSQQSFLHLVDGCTTLKHYADKVLEVADRAPFAGSEEKPKLRKRGAGYANAYDSKIDEVLFLIDDALKDLDRRLQASTFRTQFKRVFRRLPVGENPPNLQPNDPRIEEWRRQRLGGRSSE